MSGANDTLALLQRMDKAVDARLAYEDKLKSTIGELAAALTIIAGSDAGENGCYYTNRSNISIAKSALQRVKLLVQHPR